MCCKPRAIPPQLVGLLGCNASQLSAASCMYMCRDGVCPRAAKRKPEHDRHGALRAKDGSLGPPVQLIWRRLVCLAWPDLLSLIFPSMFPLFFLRRYPASSLQRALAVQGKCFIRLSHSRQGELRVPICLFALGRPHREPCLECTVDG